MTRYTITGNDHDALAIDTGEYVRYADVQAERERVRKLLAEARERLSVDPVDSETYGFCLAIDAELKRIRS